MVMTVLNQGKGHRVAKEDCLARTWSNKEGASGRTCVNGANQLGGGGDVAAP